MRALSALALALCSAAGLAHAQSNAERARPHFEAATSYYREAQYEDALREFQRAYDLTHHPDLLHDLALCEEHLGRTQQAIEHLQQYLQTGHLSASDRADVDARLARLRSQPTAEPEPVTAPTPEPVQPRQPPPPPRPDYTGLDIASWSLVGGGGAMAVVGGILIGVALGEVSSIENPPPGARWVDYAPAYASSPGLSTAGFVLAIAGAAAAVVGVVLLTLPRRDDRSRASLRITPLGLQGTF